jgi:hypothetical protein
MIAADELKFARLLRSACVVEQITVDCSVGAVAQGGRNVLKGECRSARLRDDEVLRLLRPRVDSAILVCAIEPISIQTGSRKGAERLNKVRSGWEEGEDLASQMNARHETEDGDGWMLHRVRVSLKAGRIVPVEPHQRLLL